MGIDVGYLILLGVIGMCLYPFVMWLIIWAQESETKEKEKDD
jgi:hypothetical protein